MLMKLNMIVCLELNCSHLTSGEISSQTS